MELTTQDSKRIKELELEIFNVFIDITKKLGVKYYIIEGSLLGAVRHNGFIPWDDDIDVGLPRKDYEKFISEAQKYLPEYYFLQTYETEPEYPLNFAKIRDSRTTYLETNVNNKNINHGVFFDIFPLDFYPENEKAQDLFDKKVSVYAKRIRDTLNIPQPKGFKSKILSVIARLFAKDTQTACRRKDKIYTSISSSNLMGNMSSAYKRRAVVPLDWYGEGVELEFEGLKVNAPVEYHKFLTQIYGDYMQFPPPEKRKSHHFTDIIDFDNSYIKYIK